MKRAKKRTKETINGNIEVVKKENKFIMFIKNLFKKSK